MTSSQLKQQKIKMKKNLFLSNYYFKNNYFLSTKKKSSIFSTFKGKINFNSNKYLLPLNNTFKISNLKYNSRNKSYSLLYLKPKVHHLLFLNIKFMLVLNSNKNFVFNNTKNKINNSFWTLPNISKFSFLLLTPYKNLLSNYLLFLLGYKKQYLYLTLDLIKNLFNLITIYKNREISSIFLYKNQIGFPLYLNKVTLKQKLKQVLLLRKFNPAKNITYSYLDLKNKITNLFLYAFLNPKPITIIYNTIPIFFNETLYNIKPFQLTNNKILIKKYILYSLMDSNYIKQNKNLFPVQLNNTRYFYKNMFLSLKSKFFERKKKSLAFLPSYNVYTQDKSSIAYFIQRLNDKYILTGKNNENLILLKNLLLLLWHLKQKNKLKFLSNYSLIKNNTKKVWPSLFLTFLKTKLVSKFQYKFNLKTPQLFLNKTYANFFLNTNKFFNKIKKTRYVYLNRYFVTKKLVETKISALSTNINNKSPKLYKNRILFYNINKIWAYKKISLPSSKIYVLPVYKKKLIRAQTFVHKKIVTKHSNINFKDLKHFLSLLTGQNTSVIFINALTITKYVHKSRAFVKKAVRFYLRKLDNNLINRYRFVAIYIKDLIRISYISLFFKKPTFLANFLAFQLSKLPKNRKETKFIRFLIKAIKIFSGMHREIIALRLQFKGRINRWRRTKVITAQRGFMPLPTYYFRIEYGTSKAITRKGAFGIRIWLRYKLSLMVNLKAYLLNYMKYSKLLRSQRINKFYSQFYTIN